MSVDPQQLADLIRSACVAAANDAWLDAGMQGLCGEGRWEVAIGAMKTLDLERLVAGLEDAPGAAFGDREPGRRDPDHSR